MFTLKSMQKELAKIHSPGNTKNEATNLNFHGLSKDEIFCVMLFLPATPYAFRYQRVSKYFYKTLQDAVEKGMFSYWIVDRRTPVKYFKHVKTVELVENVSDELPNVKAVLLRNMNTRSTIFKNATIVLCSAHFHDEANKMAYFKQKRLDHEVLNVHLKHFGRTNIQFEPQLLNRTLAYEALLTLCLKGFDIRPYCEKCLKNKSFFWTKNTVYAYCILAKHQNCYVGTALFTKEQVYRYCVMEKYTDDDVHKLKYVVQHDAYFDRQGLAELCMYSEGKWNMLRDAGITSIVHISLPCALAKAEHLIPQAIKGGVVVRNSHKHNNLDWC